MHIGMSKVCKCYLTEASDIINWGTVNDINLRTVLQEMVETMKIITSEVSLESQPHYFWISVIN